MRTIPDELTCANITRVGNAFPHVLQAMHGMYDLRRPRNGVECKCYSSAHAQRAVLFSCTKCACSTERRLFSLDVHMRSSTFLVLF